MSAGHTDSHATRKTYLFIFVVLAVLTALEIGLVRAAVPESDLDAVVEGRVRELLLAAPRVIAEAKALTREVAFHRVEDVHGMPEITQGAAQQVPLLESERGVDPDRRVHPRIDRIFNGEVLRRTH